MTNEILLSVRAPSDLVDRGHATDPRLAFIGSSALVRVALSVLAGDSLEVSLEKYANRKSRNNVCT